MITIDGKDVYLVGDIHRNCTGINESMLHIENSVLIFLGDLGIFNKDNYINFVNLDYISKNNNNICYFLRGNHDNPIFFNNSQESIEFFNKFNNIKLIEDMEEIVIDGKTGICIGGGISIDRTIRLINHNYFEDELIKIPEEIKNYDFILSHSGITPPSYKILNTHKDNMLNLLSIRDKELLSDIKNEQELFTKLLKNSKPKNWFFGHFHKSEDWKEGDCHFRVLDINEILRIKLN